MCTYSLLNGVTFEVLPLSRYELNPTILPLLETLFGTPAVGKLSSAVAIFFWVSLIYWNFHPFNADFIFRKSQKSFGAKWCVCVCSNSVIDFLARNYLTALCELKHCNSGQSHRFTELQVFSTQSFMYPLSVFSHDKLSCLFGLVEWIQMNNALDTEENYEHSLHLWFWHANFLGSLGCQLFPLQTLSFTSGSCWEHNVYLQLQFLTKTFGQRTRKMLIRGSKKGSLIFTTRRRNTHVLSAPQLPHNSRRCVEIANGANWNMHRLLSSQMTPFKSRNKITPGTSQSRYVHFMVIVFGIPPSNPPTHTHTHTPHVIFTCIQKEHFEKVRPTMFNS
jgi:hypothetical protein